MKEKKVSLFKFAARGGRGSMFQRKKDEDTVKRAKKSAALRKYARLCARDGIVSDRVNVDGVRKVKEEGGEEGTEGRKFIKKENKEKQHPFAAAEKKAAEAKDTKMEEEQKRKLVDAEIKRAEAVRNAKRREHMKRSSKGQPLLGAASKTLLAKIESRSSSGGGTETKR